MDAKSEAAKVLRNPAFGVIYRQFGGLSEFYAFVFMAAGITLAFLGKLDSNFAAMIVAVQGILCAHDAMDDFLQHKKEQLLGASDPHTERAANS